MTSSLAAPPSRSSVTRCAWRKKNGKEKSLFCFCLFFFLNLSIVFDTHRDTNCVYIMVSLIGRVRVVAFVFFVPFFLFLFRD